MIRQHLYSTIYDWAARYPKIRGTYRLMRWMVEKRLRGAQHIGHNVRVFGPVRIENAGFLSFGDHVEMRSSWHKPIGLFVTQPDARLAIGDGTFINWGVTVGVACSVIIGEKVLIGDECLIYDSDWHTIDGKDVNPPVAQTMVGNGVWLGARVTVLKGVTIGDNTVVAANSTVTSDLPERVLAAGTPARPIRSIQRQRFQG